MNTRDCPGGGAPVSLLGFGCMRLPQNPDKTIDEGEAARMFDYAIKHGVNYFDTAWGYHDKQSEIVTGRLLRHYPRDSFYLATKMPTWELTGKEPAAAREAAKTIFATQLEKCRVDYFDFYLLHAIGDEEVFVNNYEKSGVLEYLESEKAAGRIRRLGFSFHGSPACLEFFLSRRQWDFAQIQLNYLDWELHDAKALYESLAKRGIPAVIMEPVRGGALARLSTESAALLEKAAPDRSLASWAIRFAASLPGVMTVLSGMSTPEQVRDNVATCAEFAPVTDADKEVLRRALAAYLKASPIPCTACRYCTPCPAGVEIPKVLAAINSYNSAVQEGAGAGQPLSAALAWQKGMFKSIFDEIPENERANKCTQCQTCKPKCPQKIDIPESMREVGRLARVL